MVTNTQHNTDRFQPVILKRGPLHGTRMMLDTHTPRLDLQHEGKPLRYWRVYNRPLGTVEYHEAVELYRELRADPDRGWN